MVPVFQLRVHSGGESLIPKPGMIHKLRGFSPMKTTAFLDRTSLFEKLKQYRLTELAEAAQHFCRLRFQSEHHGMLDQWRAAWNMLPNVQAKFDLNSEAVKVTSENEDEFGTEVRRPDFKPRSDELSTCPASIESSASEFQSVLQAFHPWRKGPFELFGVRVDSEWRSNLKWDRLANHIDFKGKRVLDVGCGNGYYAWRMLGHGAEFVLGCEPFLLSVVQFEVFRKYWPLEERFFVVPMADTDLPGRLEAFDLTFSLGVLYHRTSPIDHLQILASTLKPRGQLVLDTLILQGDGCSVLVPQDRYAKMRNVWFIPTISMLERWINRSGFKNVQVLDVTPTTTQEQRSTPWMRFESLPDFLSPDNPERTIEGYPAPVRALVTATKR